MNFNVSDLKWYDIGEKTEFYLREYPKILEASLRTLQEIHPNVSKTELYKIVIKSHADLIGIPPEEKVDYAEDVLRQVETICIARSTPFCFRIIVFHLITQFDKVRTGESPDVRKTRGNQKHGFDAEAGRKSDKPTTRYDTRTDYELPNTEQRLLYHIRSRRSNRRSNRSTVDTNRYDTDKPGLPNSR